MSDEHASLYENKSDPWKCDLCGCGDNGTRYRNGWALDLLGETGHPNMPEVGSEVQALELRFQVCDRCARRVDLVPSLLAKAVAIESTITRCVVCQEEKAKCGTCPICDADDDDPPCPKCGEQH